MDLNKIGKYSSKDEFIEDLKKRTFTSEVKFHGCAQVVVQTFLDVFELDNVPVSMASSHFAAGIGLTGNNCGALIGGIMVLGLVFGRDDISKGMQAIVEGIKPTRKLVKYFEQKYNRLNCREITGTDLADPKKADAYFSAGGLERCARMMADVSGVVGDTLYEEYIKRKTGTRT
ncbi:MAG: C_GCAxxG_C_C family protein [Desulfobacteraceae bacterium]|jgi:C_GCAxxG_C_C family probable redox protein|nr:MAG: C_GCAxxG_C_C family protein [Desulfobacteraceae bacterium]